MLNGSRGFSFRILSSCASTYAPAESVPVCSRISVLMNYGGKQNRDKPHALD